MNSIMGRLVLAVALAGGVSVRALLAQDDTKALPSLVIKGEIVSLDTNDPAATLLKVKDRYGFETPIFLEQTTMITQGEQTLELAGLSSGMDVEVEYNFDVNTAKRHAVVVTVMVPIAPETAAPAAIEAAGVETPAPTPVLEEAPAEPAAPEIDAATEAAPEPEEAAPVAE